MIRVVGVVGRGCYQGSRRVAVAIGNDVSIEVIRGSAVRCHGRHRVTPAVNRFLALLTRNHVSLHAHAYSATTALSHLMER